MADPAIELLGIYWLNITDDRLREQLSILYPFDVDGVDHATAERQVREQLEAVVLIEVFVRNRDERFDVGDFAQAPPGLPTGSHQVAWAEAYMGADGTSLVVDRWSEAPTDRDLRIAFFIHSWDPSLPLQSSYGEIRCPVPQRMPDRLERLVPYEPVD
jgi:hypothetical protein